MNRPHLPPEAGGDPSQGPVPELANQTPSPRAGEDFPDAPAGQATGTSDLDQDQLDDFARRLGLRDDTDESAADDAVDAPIDGKQRWRRPASRGLHALADGTSRASGWLARVSRQIERR